MFFTINSIHENITKIDQNTPWNSHGFIFLGIALSFCVCFSSILAKPTNYKSYVYVCIQKYKECNSLKA